MCSVFRKQSRLDLHRNQPPPSLGDDGFDEEEVLGHLEVNDGRAAPNTSSSGASQRPINDDTVETSEKQTGLSMPRTAAPVAEHRKFGEDIKTEMKLVALV